jgi:hypothetical protein
MHLYYFNSYVMRACKLHAQEHAQFSLINALTFMHVKNVVKSIVNHTNVKIIELYSYTKLLVFWKT